MGRGFKNRFEKGAQQNVADLAWRAVPNLEELDALAREGRVPIGTAHINRT